MTKITRFVSLGVAVAMIAAVFSVGGTTSAQTALMCTAATPSVNVGQTQTFTVSGGSGTYTSTVQGGYSSTATNGNTITVVYPNPGTYTTTVSSGGTTANCFDVVNPAGTTTTTNGTTTTVTPLACAPASQNVNINASALFNATGGNGNYIWSGQNLVVNNATGSGFQVSYPTAGARLITVTSAGMTANCTVNVIDPFPVVVPVFPTFPNTGEAFGQ